MIFLACLGTAECVFKQALCVAEIDCIETATIRLFTLGERIIMCLLEEFGNRGYFTFAGEDIGTISSYFLIGHPVEAECLVLCNTHD